MKEQLDFAEWIFGGKDLSNLPSEVYSLWFRIYTQGSTFEELDLHKKFQGALSDTYLDVMHEFSRQSVKVLALQLLHKVYSDFAGVGVVKIFGEDDE